MKNRKAHILVPHVRSGDATADHAMELLRVLRTMYAEAGIYSNYPMGDLPGDVRASIQQTHFGDYTPDADLTIVEYPTWCPLAEHIRTAPGAAIFWYHGVTPPKLWGTDTGYDTLRQSEIRTRLAWHAHLAVTASPYMAEELHRHSHYPQDRIRVVPLGVDVTALAQPPSHAELAQVRARWNLQDKRVLVYIGRFAGNKRLDLLVDALGHLANDYPDVVLVLVGDTGSSDVAREFASRVRQQSKTLGIDDRVVMTGRVPSIVPYLHLAEIYLQASQHEGFGVPLIEAMAARRPVVASASGAMPWVLNVNSERNSPAGLIFQPGDVADLARQIRRLLDNEELRHSFQESGAARVQDFTLATFRQRAQTVMEEAVGLVDIGTPLRERSIPDLYQYADIALRSYKVRSRIPLLGRLVEWIRYNSTTHVKEAYLDRIIEQQVSYNQMLADQVEHLSIEVQKLRAELSQQK